MKRLICLCVAIMLLAATPVTADVVTGKDSKRWADEGEESPGFAFDGLFRGYVIGVYEETDKDICLAKYTINRELFAVVRKYLKDHPSLLRHPASMLVIEALKAAWPRRKEKP